MKKIVSIKCMQALQEANNRLKGTDEYRKYYMHAQIRNNGRWSFYRIGFPEEFGESYIKVVKGRAYLMIKEDIRYDLTEEVEAFIEEHNHN